LLDLRAIDVHVRDHAQARGGAQLDPAFGGKRLERFGTVAHLHVDHVGLHWLDAEPGLAQAFGQIVRVGMVIRQTLDVVIQRVQPRRREQTGLTHAAADHFAQATGLADQLG